MSREVSPVEVINRGSTSVVLVLEHRYGEPRVNEIRITPGQGVQVWLYKDASLLIRLEKTL